ncbi:TonB-dependent receptor [Elongatibacter sediminis]|uniref:TonB-dependent receptor n=1 Tax=Elongatibacter sediminis TaxID=3119006 RepID=A0AAW9R986_9GAMM
MIDIRSGGLMLALGAVSFAAHAQTGELQGAGALEEVMVTASKRGDVSIMDVPMTIQAIGADELEKRGIVQFEDYARSVSGLSFQDQGPGDKKIVLRGLQSKGAATVGVYFDDIVVTAANRQDGGGRQPDIYLVDMERIEVLKGPQATLYGASSMGGTIRMITNKPDASQVSGEFNTGYGLTSGSDDSSWHVNGVLNVPIVQDELAVRAVAYTSYRAGFIDDLLGGDDGSLAQDDVNNQDTSGGRVALRWTPSDATTVDLLWITQETTSDGPPWMQPSFGDNVQQNFTINPWEEDLDAFNLSAQTTVSHGTFNFAASYFERDILYGFPATRELCSLFGGGAACFEPENETLYDNQGTLQQPQNRSITAVEARYSSSWDSPFQVVGGLFYQFEENDFSSLVIGTDRQGRPIYQQEKIFVNRLVNNEIEQYAAFGELSYDMTDRVTVTVGARVFDISIDEVGQNLETVFRPVAADPVPTSSSESDTLFKANIAYAATDNLNLYGTFSQGYRSGGNNEPDFNNNETFPPFGSDALDSYEIGAKGRLLDGQLTFDAAAYFMEWDDIQARGLATPDTNFLVIKNVGKAEITGLEVGFAAYPAQLENFSFGGNFTIMDAELVESDPLATGGGDDGDRIPDVPEFSAYLFAEYVKSFGADHDLSARVDYSYTGDSYSTFNDLDGLLVEQGDYSLVNLSATLNYGNYRFRLYGNNIFDEDGIISGFGLPRRPDQVIPVWRRTLGVEFGMRF